MRNRPSDVSRGPRNEAIFAASRRGPPRSSHSATLLENVGPHLAEAMRAARREVDQRDFCRTEEQRIDLVKVAAVALEDGREGLAKIGGGGAGHARANF